MKDSEIYKGTVKFSFMRVLCTLMGLLLVLGLPSITFLVTSVMGLGDEVGLIAAGVALIIGFIGFGLIAHYAGYLFWAGQVAMITEGVTKNALPSDPYAAGKAEVKKRFVTATVYFALLKVTNVISTEITNGINAITRVFDPSGKGPAAIIGTVISVCIGLVLTYVNFCCLGWVFYNKNQSSVKSTLDGAVIYFQNWKTLLKNAASIIGLTLVSLVVIGGVFAGLFYVILGAVPAVVTVAAELDQALEVAAGTSLIGAAVIGGLLLWYGIHSAFVQPYILISVMRRYIEAGLANPPKVDIYGKLCKISARFKKTYEEANAEGTLA